jgi:hypothetical protein
MVSAIPFSSPLQHPRAVSLGAFSLYRPLSEQTPWTSLSMDHAPSSHSNANRTNYEYRPEGTPWTRIFPAVLLARKQQFPENNDFSNMTTPSLAVHHARTL